MEIIAHRGASHAAPENTLAAARLAWEEGADALEVDVHLTRDERLAVIHDPDTWRTAGIRRVIAASTWSELGALEVGAWKHPRYRGEKIPELGQILAGIPAGKRVFVEIKVGPEAAPALRHCVDDAHRLATHPLDPRQVVFMAFELSAAVAAKQALPAHEVCWLAEFGRNAPLPTLAEIAEAARSAGLDGMGVDAGWPMDARLVQQIRRDAFKLYTWTVDDALLARRLATAGVDGITTNRPAGLRVELGLT